MAISKGFNLLTNPGVYLIYTHVKVVTFYDPLFLSCQSSMSFKYISQPMLLSSRRCWKMRLKIQRSTRHSAESSGFDCTRGVSKFLFNLSSRRSTWLDSVDELIMERIHKTLLDMELQNEIYFNRAENKHSAHKNKLPFVSIASRATRTKDEIFFQHHLMEGKVFIFLILLLRESRMRNAVRKIIANWISFSVFIFKHRNGKFSHDLSTSQEVEIISSNSSFLIIIAAWWWSSFVKGVLGNSVKLKTFFVAISKFQKMEI